MGKYKDEHNTTRVGDFLRGVKNVAPEILDLAGSVTGVGALKKLGNAIKGDANIDPVDKETALKLLEFDIQEAQEVSKRWASDMTSDSWLSKNVRPVALISLTVFMFIVMISDSIEGWTFDVKPGYISLLESLLIATKVNGKTVYTKQ